METGTQVSLVAKVIVVTSSFMNEKLLSMRILKCRCLASARYVP